MSRGEDAPRSHRRYAARASFPFMLGIGIDDLGAFFVCVVLHVINRHRGDVAGIAIAGFVLGWLCYSIASNMLTYLHTAPEGRH